MHSRVKAAHVRIMIRFVAEKTIDICDVSDEGRIAGTLLWSLASFFDTLDCSSTWMTEDQTRRALRLGALYQLSYQELASRNLQRGRLNYKLRPKQHYFACQLLGQIEQCSLNPRCTHTFCDEDYMGRVATLASKTSGRNASLRTLQRWLMYIAQRWEQLQAS